MKLGIIGAMDVEVNLLKNKITDLTIKKEGDFVFYVGKIAHTKVVILQSGIGKVAAAIGTTLLIERYQPDYIMNTGTAGGLRKTRPGDLIVGVQSSYHDVDMTAFNYPLGQMAQQPLCFLSDSSLIHIVNHAIKKIPCKQRVNRGIILSGDSFMSDAKRVEKIEQNFPEALAVDMESAAIGQVCTQLKVPFIIVRAISDLAGEGNSKSYDTFVEKAGEIAAQIVINCIKIIEENGKNSEFYS